MCNREPRKDDLPLVTDRAIEAAWLATMGLGIILLTLAALGLGRLTGWW